MSKESRPPDEDAAQPPDATAEQETEDDVLPEQGAESSNPVRRGDREAPMGDI
jgi:hypothetical protein